MFSDSRVPIPPGVDNVPSADGATVRMSEVVAALSHALDLTEGQPEGHAGRTCLIGMRLGQMLGLGAAEQSALYYALLLKDAGCSSSAARITSMFGGADDIALKRAGKLVDWNVGSALGYVKDHVPHSGMKVMRARNVVATSLKFAREGKEIVSNRCDRGAQIVLRIGLPPLAAEAVRALDEHWDGHGQPLGLKGPDIPVLARIACLAQTAEVFLTTYDLAAAHEMVRDRRGRWFDPDVADAFLSIRASDPLWRPMNAADEGARVVAAEPADVLVDTDDEGLLTVAQAFAQVIDAKSPYTFNHSVGVARFAVGIAEAMGLPPGDVRDLNLAGLLHDIGKLAISNAILDKPARLTDDEMAVMREHPAHSERILSRVAAFARIAPIAGAHHEKLDGSGYYRGILSAEMPRLARILVVADMFEAMYADRPYREGMPVEKILAIFASEAGTKLDTDAVEALTLAIGQGILEETGATRVT